MNLAYKRVSRVKQDLRRQEEAFEDLQINKDYCDKHSCSSADRPQLNKLRLQTRDGYHIYVEKISRLRRNIDDLRQVVQEFKDKWVTIHFIKEGFSTGNSDNMFKFLLTIQGALTEMKGELTVERIREGIANAKKYGTRSSRSPRKVLASFRTLSPI